MKARQMLRLAKEENSQLIQYLNDWLTWRSPEDKDKPDLVTQLLKRRKAIRGFWGRLLGGTVCTVCLFMLPIILVPNKTWVSLSFRIVYGAIFGTGLYFFLTNFTVEKIRPVSAEVNDFLKAVTLLESGYFFDDDGSRVPVGRFGDWPMRPNVESAAKILLIEKAREKKELEQARVIIWRREEVEKLIQKKSLEFGQAHYLLKKLLPGLPLDWTFYFGRA